MENDNPVFGDDSYLKYMTRHEFSHALINPLTDRYWNSIKDNEDNYNLIPDRAKANVCGDWQECINEYIIRAVAVYIAGFENSESGKHAHEVE